MIAREVECRLDSDVDALQRGDGPSQAGSLLEELIAARHPDERSIVCDRG